MTARTGRPRGTPPVITDLTIVNIHNAARAGAPIATVAAQFGVAGSTVLEIKHARGRFKKIIRVAQRIGLSDNPPEIQDAPATKSKLFRNVPKNNILHFALRSP